MENVKKFYEALQADKALQEKANLLNEQFKGTDPKGIDEEASKKAIVSFASANGFDFTSADLDAYQKELRVLSDEQLEAIGGGVYSNNTCLCLTGGYGRDSESGRWCACTIAGGGASDYYGKFLACAWIGVLGQHEA